MRLALLSSLAAPGCLAPPDAEVTVPGPNYPPEILLDSVRPRGPILAILASCTGFSVSVGEVVDHDDDELVYRLVANNGENRVRPIIERRLLGAQRGLVVRENVNPAFSFVGYDTEGFGNPHTLSLLVTDAPRFRFEENDPSAIDKGQIEPDDAGVLQHSVVELRWVVNFTPGGVCPGS